MRYEIEERYQKFLEWYVKQKDLRPMKMDYVPRIRETSDERDKALEGITELSEEMGLYEKDGND